MKQLKETMRENTGSIVQESFGDKFREKIYRFFHPFSKMYPRPFVIITEGRTSVSSGGDSSKEIYDALCSYMEENYEDFIREVRIQRTVDTKLDNRIYILDKDRTTYKNMNNMMEDLARELQDISDSQGARLLAMQNDVSGGHELEICVEIVEDELAAYPGIAFNTFRKHNSPIIKRLEKIYQDSVRDTEPEPEPRRRAGYRQQGAEDAWAMA